MLCATVGYSLTTEFSGAAPGGVDDQRYTRALAALLTGAQHPGGRCGEALTGRSLQDGR
jgi:hypothetical protein